MGVVEPFFALPVTWKMGMGRTELVEEHFSASQEKVAQIRYERMERKIGQLVGEVDRLSKARESGDHSKRKAMVESTHP